MPPGKITTYQEFEEEQRRKRLEAIRRQPIQSLNSVEGPARQPAAAPARPTSALPNPQSALPQTSPAPQRGYDPRFDDPNYGLPDKARPAPLSAKPAPLPWRSPEPSPAAVGALLNRTPTPPYQPPSPPPLGPSINRTPPPSATPNNRWQPVAPTPQRSLLPNNRWQPNIANIDQQPEPPIRNPQSAIPSPLTLSSITNPPLPGASIGSTQPSSPTLRSPQPAASTQPLSPQPLPPLSSNPAIALYQDRARQYEQERIRGEDTAFTYGLKSAGNLLQLPYNTAATIPLPVSGDSPVGRAMNLEPDALGQMPAGQVVMPLLRTLFGAGQPEPAFPAQWQPTNGSMYAPSASFSTASILDNMQQYVVDQWASQNALNQAINALPPDQANAARIATNFVASGAQAQWAGFDLIRQKQQLPQLYAQAQQLAEAGKAKEASAAYLYANSLRAQSYTDLAESQSSPLAEFVANVFLDPLNLLDAPIGIALDASRAARAASAIRALESAAPAALDDALTAGQRLLGLTQAGQPAMPPRNWLQQLIGRTPETQAHFAADSLLQSASQLYRNVENAADARIITEAWLNNPRSLVTGLSGLTSPGFQAGKDANGLYRFGFGAVGMPEQLKAMPVLSLIKDDLLASPALNDASFNPLQWLTTVDNAIYRGARQANGLVALDELPFGATRAAIANKAPQKYSIDYYDAKNNLLGSSPLMSFDAAKKYKANLDNAIQAGQKSPIMRGVRGMANVQRAMLSDMWLNLRPTHWVRNAASATAATMADDLYSLRKQADIIADLSKKFAFGAPTERIAGAIGPEAAPAAFDEQRHISRQLWDKGNPLAAASEAGAKIWTGTTEIMGLPFGEQSFYLKAFDRGFNRTFRQAWSGAVDRTLTPLYETLGIAPDVGRKITDRIISSGVNGSRSDMQVAARNAVNGQYLPFDLRQLKIPDELLSAEGQRQINRIISEWYASGPSPANLTPQVETALRTTFANERTRYTDMLRESPPQPGNYDWTKQDIQDTSAEIIDQMTEAARATGGDVAAAEAAGQQLASQVADAEIKALESFMDEVKLTPANIDAMNVAFDLLARLHKLKTATRSEVDQLARVAADTLGAKPLRDAAWQRKFSETGRLYTQYAADVQAEIGASLNDLRTVLAGGQVERRYDWWQALNRYFQFDEEANAMQRATVLGSTGATPRDVWEKTIEANRLYVDQSFVQTYDAFRRFPSIDSMDVLRWAHDNVDDYGARAAAYLAPLRAKAWEGKLDWEKYFAIRNRVWTQVFDNQVVINDLAKRAIVSNGLSGAGAGNLRWEDPFVGSIYQLIGPGQTDAAGNVITWKAYDIQRRKIEEFANVTGAGSALPDVPQQIIDSYHRITDQLAKIKPTLDEIAQSNPLPPKPARSAYTSPQLTPLARMNIDSIFPRELYPQRSATTFDPANLLDYAYDDPANLLDSAVVRPQPAQSAIPNPQSAIPRTPYESPTVTPIDRPATGFDDIATRPYGPAEPLPPPTQPEIDFNATPVTARSFAQQMQQAYRLTPEQSNAIAALADARAQVWAQQTGLSADDWYSQHLAEIGPGNANAIDDQALLQYQSPWRDYAIVGNQQDAVAMARKVSPNPQVVRVVQLPGSDSWAVQITRSGDKELNGPSEMGLAGFLNGPSTPVSYPVDRTATMKDRRMYFGTDGTMSQEWNAITNEWVIRHRMQGNETDLRSANMRFQNRGSSTASSTFERTDSQTVESVPSPLAGWRVIARSPNRETALQNAAQWFDSMKLPPAFKQDIYELLQESTAGTAKGSAQFLADQRAILRGFQSADVSTAAHEMAHVFRRDLTDVARFNRQAAADLLTAEKWAGVVDSQWSREAEEMFARGFETYLRTGNAPSDGLRRVFEQFKQWMSTIYRTLKGTQLPDLPADMRQVYDNLLTPADTRGKSWYRTPNGNVVFTDATDARLSGMRSIDEATARDFLGIAPDQPLRPADYPSPTQAGAAAEEARLSTPYQTQRQTGPALSQQPIATVTSKTGGRVDLLRKTLSGQYEVQIGAHPADRTLVTEEWLKRNTDYTNVSATTQPTDVGAIPNRTPTAIPNPQSAIPPDPTARLTKPSNWTSTQRSAPLAVGQRVTTPQGPGTVTRDANSYYGVKLDNGRISRFKRSNVQALTTPTAQEAAQGQAIAQAAAPSPTAPTFGQPTTPTRPATANMFAATNEDLPLISGAPTRPQDAGPFRPPEATARQKTIFDMRPQMGDTGVTQAKPKPRVAAKPARISDRIAELMSDIDDYKQTRLQYRKEWDRVAVGELGLPKLDAVNLQFNRGGFVNLSKNAGDSNDQFADLWGNTIAGIELNNTDDLQKLIDQYADQQRRIDAATDKIAKYNKFKKLSGPEIVEQITPQLLADGLSQADIADLAKMDRNSILDYYEALTEDASQIGYRYYATGMPLSPDLLRTVADDWQPINPAEIWRNLVTYWGKGKQPEVGDVARHMVRTLNDAEDAIINSLPALAQQPPNALNASARNAIISAVDRLGPSFDNAVAVSRNAAQNLADGAMLNYNDRRGFDQILSLVFPYHYYWTRGGLNWAKRLARKPSYLNLIQEVNRFQDNRQQQLDTPQRMDSYIPAGKVGDTVIGVANPLNWILPRYTPNEFIDPEDARSQAERYWLMIQQSTPGLLPLLAYGADAFFDWQSGATNADRKATANLRQFVPAAGIAADAYQAATGKVSPPGIGPGDPWDPYRVRTTLAVMAQEKAIDPATAQYAQQIAFNLESGKDRYAGIPPAAKTSADAAYTQAAQRSGAQRLLTTATNYLTGSALTAAPQAEIDLRKQQRDYNAAGYDPTANPYGSNALRRDILDANPALPTMWTRNATETNQPATSAQRSERWDALTNAIFNPMNQAVTEAIRRNPAATPAQIAAIKAPFYGRIDAINARFPLAVGSGSSRPPSGATPQERALYELQRIIESAGGPAPTWPGDDATPGQLAAYRQQKDIYDQRKLSTIESNLSQLLRQVESDPTQPWQNELANLVRGQYATDLKRNYDDLAYAQPTEKAWAEEAYFKRAASNAQWQDKQKQVAKRMGAAAIPQWTAYHQADDATRTAMRDADPAIKEMLMAGYNPAEYDAAIVEFGPQAWSTYFDPNYPKFPDNATQDQLNAYYAQRDAYEASHPRSSELRFWLNGRYRWSDEASSPVNFYDFGKDWKEAQRVFGPNIFDIERQANAAPDYGAWARSHQQQADLLTGYRQWKSALSDTPTSRSQLPTLNLAATPRQPQQLSSQPFRATYTGPDPYAAMTPIGADPIQRTPTAPTAPYIPPAPPAIPPALPPAAPPTAPTAPYNPPVAVGAIPNRTSSPTDMPAVPTAQPWRSPTAAPLDAPVTDPYTGLTAQQWAARDPKYIQRQARLDQVQQQFGAEGLQQFQEYANLPADSPQRDEYRRLHPQISLINMAAYDGANYNNLVEMFGQDALNSWANTPAWGESEAEQNIRKEYLDANPIAWLVDAYVDGRPTPYDPNAPQTERNHGADWALAEQQFGADIWQRIAAYRAADSGTRRAMRDADPAIMQFYDWWYAALPDTGAGGGRPVATYRSADGLVTYDQYGRRLDSNGNVARGFYPSSSGGGGGGGSSWRSYPPEVRPRYMDERLWYASDLRAWRPPDNDINMNWLNAGSRVGPDRIVPWRAPN